MAGTEIKKCECKHEYQDSKHGKGYRVHNVGAGANPKKKCTVCGKSN